MAPAIPPIFLWEVCAGRHPSGHDDSGREEVLTNLARLGSGDGLRLLEFSTISTQPSAAAFAVIAPF